MGRKFFLTCVASGLIGLAIAVFLPHKAQASGTSLTLMARAELHPIAEALLSVFRARYPSVPVRTIHGNLATSAQHDFTPDAWLWLTPGGGNTNRASREAALAGAAQLIARQPLVIWSRVRNIRHMNAANLLAGEFKRVAMADPVRSPSGRAAKQALMRAGLWGPLHGRLVFADTAEKAAALVRSGAVDAGILPMTVIKAAGAGAQGSFARLSQAAGSMPELHLGLSAKGAAKPEALDMLSSMMSPTARAVLARYGYRAP